MHFTRKEGLKTQETESKEEDSEEHGAVKGRK